MPQLTFAWSLDPSYAAEDFILSACNEEAAAFCDNWAGKGAALLTGEARSGKTHLAHRFASGTGAAFLDMEKLGMLPSAEFFGSATHAVLEDIHAARDETALFHLLRHTETHGLSLLLTSRLPAKELPFTLPDLSSRIAALPGAQIHAPDESLLHAFVTKSFADRQLRVDGDVIRYLLPRMERSFAGAIALVEKIAGASLEARRDITIPFVKSLLESR